MAIGNNIDRMATRKTSALRGDYMPTSDDYTSVRDAIRANTADRFSNRATRLGKLVEAPKQTVSTPAATTAAPASAATINVAGYSVPVPWSGGYMQAYQNYVAQAEARKNNTYKGFQEDLAANNATTNANYDQSARQAYVDYMRKQRALPSQLQSLGVRGGATESGLLNLYNSYGASHAANEQQRNADLTSNQRDFDTNWRQYMQNYDADLSDRYQTAVANQMNEYNNEITRFSSSVAQYPTTENGYKAYQNWINALAVSGDPLAEIKIALVRQQMASQFPTGAPQAETKSSGGGGKKSSGGGSSSKKKSGGGGNGGGGSSSSKNAVASGVASGSSILRQIAEDALKSTKLKKSVQR